MHLRKKPKRSKLKRIFYDLIAPPKINLGWAMDFLSDWVVGAEKQAVRIINVIDECSRKALWTEAKSNISARTLVKILDQLIEWGGKHGIKLRFTQPGKPTQNAIIERLNGTLRKECLNLKWFDSLDHLNEQLQQWWNTYNSIRPHSSIGHKTPDQIEKENKNIYFSVVAN